MFPREDPVAEVRVHQGKVVADIALGPATRTALRSLDEVDVQHLFQDRAVVVKSLLREAADGTIAWDEPGLSRAWKLFLLLPRMLLFRPARGGFSQTSSENARRAQFRRSRTATDSV